MHIFRICTQNSAHFLSLHAKRCTSRNAPRYFAQQNGTINDSPYQVRRQWVKSKTPKGEFQNRAKKRRKIINGTYIDIDAPSNVRMRVLPAPWNTSRAPHGTFGAIAVPQILSHEIPLPSFGLSVRAKGGKEKK